MNRKNRNYPPFVCLSFDIIHGIFYAPFGSRYHFLLPKRFGCGHIVCLCTNERMSERTRARHSLHNSAAGTARKIYDSHKYSIIHTISCLMCAFRPAVSDQCRIYLTPPTEQPERSSPSFFGYLFFLLFCSYYFILMPPTLASDYITSAVVVSSFSSLFRGHFYLSFRAINFHIIDNYQSVDFFSSLQQLEHASFCCEWCVFVVLCVLSAWQDVR